MGIFNEVDAQFFHIQRLLRHLWEQGNLSDAAYLQQVNGIDRCVRVWRSSGRPTSWIMAQLKAVEDELMEEIARVDKQNK